METLMLVVLSGFLFLLLILAIRRIGKLMKENEALRDEVFSHKEEVRWKTVVVQETQGRYEIEVALRQQREREVEELHRRLQVLVGKFDLYATEETLAIDPSDAPAEDFLETDFELPKLREPELRFDKEVLVDDEEPPTWDDIPVPVVREPDLQVGPGDLLPPAPVAVEEEPLNQLLREAAERRQAGFDLARNDALMPRDEDESDDKKKRGFGVADEEKTDYEWK